MDWIWDEMMMNLEEEWDIQNAIWEIKDLEKSNKEQILTLAHEMEDLIEQKEQISQSEVHTIEQRNEIKC